jgi:outer membrane lipoprotein-sorting protein
MRKTSLPRHHNGWPRPAGSPGSRSEGYPVLSLAAKAARRLCHLALAVCCSVAAATALAQATPDDEALARTIVEKADEVRFPQKGFEVQVSIESTLAEGKAESRQYRVLSKGNQNTLVMVTEPASERGQILLMKGRDLWIYMPTLSQPVRLSLSQRLTGEVANGDLARANFAGDYTPKLLRTETVDGEPTYVLQLDAAERGVTYHRVMYWVRKDGYRPVKAEFYSVSDRMLKSATYEDYRSMGGRVRPTRMVMRDALHEGERSVLEYRDMKLRDLPDKMFTKDYLKHLE